MRASVNYVAAEPGTAVPFLLDADWSGAAPSPVEVEMVDGMAEPPSLDQEGFTRARLVSGVTDFADPAQIEALWMPAAANLVARLTGAAWAVGWAPNVRFSKQAPQSRETPVAAPAPLAHADQLPDFDIMALNSQPGGEHAASEIERRLGPGKAPARWRIYNVWQQISPPPQDTPLALCDLRTVTAEDAVEGQGRLPGTEGPVFSLTFFRASPRHRWVQFPDMLPGEALVFSGLDPQAGALGARVPHTAFSHPDAPAHCVPRNSIEMRVLAVFDE